MDSFAELHIHIETFARCYDFLVIDYIKMYICVGQGIYQFVFVVLVNRRGLGYTCRLHASSNRTFY